MASFGLSAEGAISTTTSSASGSGRETGTVRRLTAEDQQFVRQLMQQFAPATNVDAGKARQQAVADVQANINNLFTQFRETALPQIMSAQGRTGGYGSSTSQLLANDAYARTVAQGASLAVDAITKYEQQALARSQLAMQGLSTSLEALLQAQQESDVSSEFKTRSKSTTRDLSSGLSIGF